MIIADKCIDFENGLLLISECTYCAHLSAIDPIEDYNNKSDGGQQQRRQCSGRWKLQATL